VQVREESRRQGAALDEMRARVELRRARVGELLVARRDAARGVDRRREQLQAQIDRVLRLSGAVAAASRRLQVIDTNAACIEN
jgi:ABC-type transporter Mla subunit MlaD